MPRDGMLRNRDLQLVTLTKAHAHLLALASASFLPILPSSPLAASVGRSMVKQHDQIALQSANLRFFCKFCCLPIYWLKRTHLRAPLFLFLASTRCTNTSQRSHDCCIIISRVASAEKRRHSIVCILTLGYLTSFTSVFISAQRNESSQRVH